MTISHLIKGFDESGSSIASLDASSTSGRFRSAPISLHWARVARDDIPDGRSSNPIRVVISVRISAEWHERSAPTSSPVDVDLHGSSNRSNR